MAESNSLKTVLESGIFTEDESKASTDAYHIYIGGSDGSSDGDWEWQNSSE